jgi:hypothetical protein
MPINMTVRMHDVWRRVGTRKAPHPYTFDDPEWRLQRVTGDPVGVCFAWEKKHSFLCLRAWHATPEQLNAGQEEAELRRGDRALLDTYERFHLRMHVPPAFLRDNELLTGIVPRSARVRLLFCIDTDLDSFRTACEAVRPGGGPLSILLQTQVFDASGNEEHGQVRLELGPCVLPDAYRGFLAVDLGNTSSTVTAHPGHLLDHNQAWVVDSEGPGGCTDVRPLAEQKMRTTSAGSAVRLEAVNTALLQQDVRWRDKVGCFVWSIGDRALDKPSSDGVELGAKRLLAGRDYNEARDWYVYPRLDYRPEQAREPVALPRRLPGELLLCRLFQRFREKGSCQLPLLALTYPTGYSRREIAQLRDVACRAIARQNGWDQGPARLAEANNLIKDRMLDEASASAFFFLFRDVLRAAPGLSRFRYLHPNGLHMLLYDCGGGTTDIGLVKATVDRAAPNILRVEVAGRSAVRDFGGDEITAAIFRLLKASIAARVQEVRGAQAIRLNAATLEADLSSQAGRINDVVPTQYDRLRMNKEDRRNRDHARHLWQRAQSVKHLFKGSATDAVVRPFGPQEAFDDLLSQHLLAGLPAEKRPALFERLRSVQVKRPEVDGLIREKVELSVRRCNQLIRKRLVEEAAGAPEEVERVVLLGNGSHYPLVQQALREQLNVLFYDERRVFDEEELKTAVAKGAVLALGMKETVPDVRIDFDWSACARLPYDVGYVSKGALVRWLYFEGQSYDEIANGPPQQVAVLPGELEQRPHVLQLVRRWPGDEPDQRRGERGYEPYLTFDFAYGIDGTVTIEHDPMQEFRAIDSSGQAGKLVSSGNEEVYLHPVERGTL